MRMNAAGQTRAVQPCQGIRRRRIRPNADLFGCWSLLNLHSVLATAIRPAMPALLVRIVTAALAAAAIGSAVSLAAAQPAGEQKPQEGQKPPAQQNDAAKEEKKKIDEFAEAARVLSGPAGNPECVWLGRRVVNLLWRDDLDTAFRHLDLYDRFGCPAGHIQATFRCVVRQGNIDPKAPESLSSRVHACWINPNLPPATASAAPPGTAGTSNQ